MSPAPVSKGTISDTSYCFWGELGLRMDWRKQSPTASASAAEWVECGMLRGNCLCYFNTNEFRNSVSGDVLNSARHVTSTPALTKQMQKPGLRKKPEALPSSSHRHPDSHQYPSAPGIQVSALFRQATWLNCSTAEPPANIITEGTLWSHLCPRQAAHQRQAKVKAMHAGIQLDWQWFLSKHLGI